jgi:hypothetical protein
MPDTTTTTPGTIPRTVPEDTPVSTPTTPTRDNPPAEVPAARWFYWVAFFARGGAVGACEMSGPERITRGEHVTGLQETLARQVGLPSVGISSFTLLRVEDADGQVIG